jgi:hypothetical protein
MMILVLLSNITAKWLVFLLSLWEVLGSNLSPEARYPD